MLYRKRTILSNPDDRDRHIIFETGIAVADQVSGLVGGKPRTFAQFYPPAPQEPQQDPELTKRICKAHGLNLIEE
jgi:hypothetical protein